MHRVCPCQSGLPVQPPRADRLRLLEAQAKREVLHVLIALEYVVLQLLAEVWIASVDHVIWFVRPCDLVSFPTNEFHPHINKIPRFNRLPFNRLQLRPSRRGGGLVRKQGKSGTGIHFSGEPVSHKAKL
jgi:hypothetical protein